MGKKNKNHVTKMRVNSDVKQRLNAIKYPKETDAQFLERIANIFSNRGIPREIGDCIIKLQHISNHYVSPELHEPLEYLRVILIALSRIPNQETRAHEARIIGNFLRQRLEGVQKSIEDYQK